MLMLASKGAIVRFAFKEFPRADSQTSLVDPTSLTFTPIQQVRLNLRG